jgi:hypothetical protein
MKKAKHSHTNERGKGDEKKQFDVSIQAGLLTGFDFFSHYYIISR